MLNCPANKSFKCVLLAFLVSYAGQSASVLAYINQQPYDLEHMPVTPQGFSGESTTLFGSDIDALLLVPEGFEQGFRQPAIEATTRRFESLIAAQVAAGADIEATSSDLTLTVFFIGDLTGATQLGEGLFSVDLATNQTLSTGESIRRGVQGGSTIVIIAAGPKALRNARARSAGLLLQPTEAALTAESQAARAASNFEAGVTELSVAQTQSSIVRPSIRNLLPQRVARVIPGRGPFATLGRPGADDVFVTTVDDIAGLNPGQIAQRLGIPKSDVFTVIEFPTPATGLASPVFRDNPGFIGGGRTIGGAVEFVVPNGHIPPNAVIKVIGP